MHHTKHNVRSFAVTVAARVGRLAVAGLAVLSLTAAAGCHDTARENGALGGELFIPEGPHRTVNRTAEVQAAVAARLDATLRPYHFDRAELNSLGRQKLDLMLKDEESSLPLVVYLDLPANADTDARRDTVGAYLKERGLMDVQVRLEVGPNPENGHPAGPSMRMAHLLDSNAAVAANPEPTGSAGATPPAAAH